MKKKETKESQYNASLDIVDEIGFQRFGIMTNQAWYDDPKRLAFTFSRYKFVNKMLIGKNNVLEIGCADAFGTRIVRQDIPNVTAIDFDSVFIEDAKLINQKKWHINLLVHDILKSPMPEKYDGAYSLDVIEHIDQKNEDLFLSNIVASLTEDAALIIGCPSLESQKYASPQSREGHINCKSGSDLRKLMQKYFQNVFMFSMNDEVIHTGYMPLAHYLFAVCCMKK